MLLIDWMPENHPEIRIVVPKSDFNTNVMSHYALGEVEFKVGRFSIPEPVSGDEVAIKSIDLAIVPLIAVDKRGHRVGYGRGFYDRFLIECRPDVQTTGVSFFDLVEEIVAAGLTEYRKGVVKGQSVSVREEVGGCGIQKKKTQK